MDSLYHQTNALIQQTQEKFKQLNRHGGDPEEVEIQIQEKINTINSNCERLDLMVMKVPIGQRPNAKMRCDQLKYDNKHLQAALAAEQQRRKRQEIAKLEREQLLNRRFAPNPEATMLDMDFAVQHNESMNRVHKGVDEMLYTGAETLESLRSQRFTLKGAQRKIIDMANTLGLSTYTMKLIDRRVIQDKYILIGGMLVTVSVMALVIIYWA
ncbi:probable Golgi SNAP receptor complex member 2 [Onthophagus taurus]|uniref:probable Golgi SNAP receptor complex member 2 n=1 Tax=Onthophagus taurus TaxID=166361 RepID=UPI000C2006E9|nr:probable Golgi SNAP receptor complex member 2 [Onthophagus taurus]